MRSFLNDYVGGVQDLNQFFAASPESLLAQPPATGAWDTGLVESLRAYQKRLGHTVSFDGTEAVVVTGQQPAIFTGPLYTVYKAITALKLADAIESRQGTPCVPVFWVGSEDHDFDEACSAHVLDRNHRKASFTYAPEASVEGLPMSRVPVEPSLHEMVDEMAGLVAGGGDGTIAELLHDTLNEAASLSDWSARLLARLFEGTRLVFFTPDLPEARQAGRAVLEREIRTPLVSTGLLNAAALQLERLDFAPQLVKGAKECNFFLEFDALRRKVLFEKGRFQIPEEEASFSEKELLALLDGSPERFSPNVALRCVVQQRLFPVAAYVAGPGELAYWAQLKPVFEHFELPMPIVYPRARCALTTIKLNKLLAKLKLSAGDLDAPGEVLREKALRATSKNPAIMYVEEKRADFEKLLREFTTGLEALDPTAASMASGIDREVSSGLDRIERAILGEATAKNEAALKQLGRLCESLMPGRKPQERVYTIFSYLFEHGLGLVPRLTEAIDPECFEMQEIEL